jgi:predicted phage terminase large subunit-like protein
VKLDEEGVLLAKENLLAYAVLMRWQYETPDHIKLIAEKLEELEKRKIRRLMIFMPPRHGKSHLANELFPSWYIGRNPGHEVITTSYSQEVASGFGRKVRNMMNEPNYKLIFHGVGPREDSYAAHRFDLTTGGTYYAVGAGGPLTSRGASLIVIDDIHKNRSETQSEALLTRIKEWFGPVLYTRLAPDGVVVLIQTRWSERDLPGHLLSAEGDRWEVLSLPAISEAGRALWPERFPIETLNEIKRTIGSRDFNALYQQTPSAEEGDILKRHWWKFYTAIPSDISYLGLSVDLSFSEGSANSYAVFQTWGRRGPDKYLLDQYRAQIGFTEQLNMFRACVGKWPDLNAKWVEKKANGAALIATLQKEIAGIVPVEPKGSKEARAEAVSPQIESGNVYLPDPSIAPWIGDFIEECAMFPNGAHDDQVDAMSQALMKLNEGVGFDWQPISMKQRSKWLRN